MVCVYCGHKTQVINSRLQRRSNSVWRRRRCYSCSAVFTTSETTDYTATWTVRGSDGRPVPFNRDKLLMSLYQSLQHRSDALESASELTDTIIRKLSIANPSVALPSSHIALTAQVALHRFDTLAGTHYQAFHKHK